MSFIGAAIGGAVAIGGAALSSRSQDKASKRAAEAAEFRPFAINTSGTNTGFDLRDNSLTSVLNPQLQTASNIASSGVAGGLLAGTTGTDRNAQRQIFQQGRGQQGLGLRNVPGAFNDFNSQLLGQQGDLAGLQQGFAGQLGGAQQGAQFGTNTALLQGAGLLGQDFGQLRADQLNTFRQQAQPENQRAVNSTLQNLFGTGRLGTTGGANVIGRLAEAQNQQDLGFQNAATQTAQNQFQLNQNAGQGLLGLGLQGSGLQGSLAATGLEGQTGALNAILSRGQSRLGAAQQLFGFGSQVTQQPFQEAQQNLGIQASLNDQEMAALDASIRAGGGQASAGANQAAAILANSGSPIGAAAGEFGVGLLGRSMDKIFPEKA